MKRILSVVVVLGWVAGPVREARQKTPEETLAKIERDFAEMQMTKDRTAIAAVAATMSDDFYSFDPTTGQRISKAQLIAAIESPNFVVKSVKFPPLFIRVFGSTAVVQGVNDETVTYGGKDVTGTYAWFDVFEKRDGTWVWIVSESGKAGATLSGKVLCDRSLCSTSQPGFSLKS
jgi:ketosteroid isomerase-like protein